MYKVRLYFADGTLLRTYENIVSYTFDYDGTCESQKTNGRLYLINKEDKEIIINTQFNYVIEEY